MPFTGSDADSSSASSHQHPMAISISGAPPSENVYLVSTEENAISPKNFFIEIRGILDVEHLLKTAIVLLDVDCGNLEILVKTLLNAIPQHRRPNLPYIEIRKRLFSFSKADDFHVPVVRHRIQGMRMNSTGVPVVDQSWLVIYGSFENLDNRTVAFARMNLPTNFGPGLGDVQFVTLVLAPIFEKDTKSALETAHTFSTLFGNVFLRQRLLDTYSSHTFITEINNSIDRLAFELPLDVETKIKTAVEAKQHRIWYPGRGIVDDVCRRGRQYQADFTDGFSDTRSLRKTISSAVFLYFAIVPTAIALGMLNDANTNGLINVKKEILAQWIGGLLFGLTGGQLFLIMLSTAPISIYIQVIHDIAESGGHDFFKMFTMTGLWCSAILIVFAFFEASIIMKYAKRSLEELFGLFISIALIVKAVQATVDSIGRYRSNCPGAGDAGYDKLDCDRSVGLLFLLLVAGTLWISMTLYNFRTTPFLTKTKREILADYALPIGVVIVSFIGSYCFESVPQEVFTYDPHSNPITVTAFWDQPGSAHVICFGLSIPLAILFFMDQSIVTNTVDNSQNNLQKGPAANWDLFVVAIMNVILSVLGLPWMHGALPQAFLHLKAMADVEDRLVNGTVQQVIVKNRESRLATIIAHVLMIPTYFWLLPILQLVPTAVFHGLFLYLALTSMIGNELCERRSYPPLHYIRRVPQRIVHFFTLTEVIQLALLCFIGFAPWPVLEMAFPIVTFLFIPFRSLILPFIFEKKHLEALDGVH
uniref:Sodium bicarbonate transporter-like protein 11 n=1 Tax=Panagrellus redivivus TaxID=6233 RepID=A0A7E4UNX0_PANRE